MTAFFFGDRSLQGQQELAQINRLTGLLEGQFQSDRRLLENRRLTLASHNIQAKPALPRPKESNVDNLNVSTPYP
jgi:hypothetical protein